MKGAYAARVQLQDMLCWHINSLRFPLKAATQRYFAGKREAWQGFACGRARSLGQEASAALIGHPSILWCAAQVNL